MSTSDIKTYCVTFGVLDVNVPAFTQYLYDSVDIVAFWNYVPLVYCVKSRLTATEIAAKMRSFFPHGTYLVAEINPANIDGALPKAAWEWFYLPHHQKTHAPSVQNLPLGFAGLLGLPKS